MAGTNETITLTILAKDLASGNIGGLVGRMDALAKRGGLAGSVMQGVGIQMGMMLNPIGLVTQGIGFLTNTMSDMVNKAAEEEKGIVALDVALKNNIPAWDGNRDAIEGVIAARETLAFSDGEQRDSLAQLVVRTHDATKALDLERLAMDLARAKGIDLATAATLIGKVYGGNVAILQRYGIAVTKGATATQALGEIQKATAGQAEAYAGTLQGTQENLTIAIEDAQEAIGQKLMPAIKEFVAWLREEGVPGILKFGDVLGELGTQFNNFQRFIQPWIAEVQDAFRETADQIGVDVDDLSDAFIKANGKAATSMEQYKAGLPAALAIVNSALTNSGEYANRYGATVTAAVIGANEEIALSEEDLAKTIEKNMAAANASIASLVPTSRDTLKQLKQDAKASLHDYIWNMNHATDIAKAAAIVEREMSNAQLQKGLARHEALAQATMADLIVKLGQLRGQAIDAGEALQWVLGMGPIPGIGVEWLTGPRNRKHHGGGSGSGMGGGRARGGPVGGAAGSVFTVGENGPETLVMGGGATGNIVANGRGGGVHVHLHGIFTGTVDGLRQLGEILMPVITKAQRRGQLG